jgi:hypothetical protein
MTNKKVQYYDGWFCVLPSALAVQAFILLLINGSSATERFVYPFISVNSYIKILQTEPNLEINPAHVLIFKD